MTTVLECPITHPSFLRRIVRRQTLFKSLEKVVDLRLRARRRRPHATLPHLAVVEVTLPSPFSLPYSKFNEFPFASIGKEGNGMSLSVVSALARFEMDPWQEAARLSDLPKNSRRRH
jgi:hypothetical protein